MYDFNNLKLIPTIENNPFERVVQRTINLSDAFLLGDEHILLTVKNIELFKIKYKNILSIKECANVSWRVETNK